jgi:hypothetical protein
LNENIVKNLNHNDQQQNNETKSSEQINPNILLKQSYDDYEKMKPNFDKIPSTEELFLQSSQRNISSRHEYLRSGDGKGIN